MLKAKRGLDLSGYGIPQAARRALSPPLVDLTSVLANGYGKRRLRRVLAHDRVQIVQAYFGTRFHPETVASC